MVERERGGERFREIFYFWCPIGAETKLLYTLISTWLPGDIHGNMTRAPESETRSHLTSLVSGLSPLQILVIVTVKSTESLSMGLRISE